MKAGPGGNNMSTNKLQFPELGWENKRMFEVPRARSGSTRFRGRFRRRLVQSQVRFNKICGHLTNGNPAEVFPALGFAARFRKICKNKTLRLLGIPPKLIFSVFISGIKFIFVYLSMICIFFPRSRPGLADITMYLLIRIWERISHRLERVICIVLFILIVMWFPPISLSSLEPFSFVSCQTCGSSASVLVWTLLQVLVPKGSAVHDPKTKEIKREKVKT